MIIGLTGQDKNGNTQGVGKTTTAQLICLIGNTNLSTANVRAIDLELWFENNKTSSFGWQIKPIAEPLKKFATYWTSPGDLEDQEVKKQPSNLPDLTNRQILERLGEGIRQILHPDAWIKARLADYKPDRHFWILPDVRYPNELQAITQKGGIVFNVQNLSIAQPKSDHPSNTALVEMRKSLPVINNPGDNLDQLAQEIKRAFAEVQRTRSEISLRPWV